MVAVPPRNRMARIVAPWLAPGHPRRLPAGRGTRWGPPVRVVPVQTPLGPLPVMQMPLVPRWWCKCRRCPRRSRMVRRYRGLLARRGIAEQRVDIQIVQISRQQRFRRGKSLVRRVHVVRLRRTLPVLHRRDAPEQAVVRVDATSRRRAIGHVERVVGAQNLRRCRNRVHEGRGRRHGEGVVEGIDVSSPGGANGSARAKLPCGGSWGAGPPTPGPPAANGVCGSANDRPAGAAVSVTRITYSPMRKSSPSVSSTCDSRGIRSVAPLTNTPLVLRSVSMHRPPAATITQCVLDSCRSGSASTQSLPGARPMDRVPCAECTGFATGSGLPAVQNECQRHGAPP